MNNVIMELGGLEFCRTVPDELDRIIEIERDNSNFVFKWPRDRHLDAILRDDEEHITIKPVRSGEIVGYIILAGIGEEDDALEFRRMAISEKGRGYGRTSVAFIKKYCFEILDCHRLWLDAYTDNKAAIALYRQEGFVQEAVLRECKKYRDTYRSMVIMSMLKYEYKGI